MRKKLQDTRMDFIPGRPWKYFLSTSIFESKNSFILQIEYKNAWTKILLKMWRSVKIPKRWYITVHTFYACVSPHIICENLKTDKISLIKNQGYNKEGVKN